MGKQNVAGTLRSFVGAKQNVAGTIREALYIKQNVAGTIRTLWQKNIDTSTWWGYHGYTASSLAGSTVSMSTGYGTITNVTLNGTTATFTIQLTSDTEVLGFSTTYFAGYSSSGDRLYGSIYKYNYSFSDITIKFPKSSASGGITSALFSNLDISDVSYSYWYGYGDTPDTANGTSGGYTSAKIDTDNNNCNITTDGFSFKSKTSTCTVTVTVTAAILDYSNKVGPIVTKAGYTPTGTYAGTRKPDGSPYSPYLDYYNFTDGYTGEFTVNRRCKLTINAVPTYLNTGVIQLCDTSNTVLHTFCNRPTPNDATSNIPITVDAGTYKIKYSSLSWFLSIAPFAQVVQV